MIVFAFPCHIFLVKKGVTKNIERLQRLFPCQNGLEEYWVSQDTRFRVFLTSSQIINLPFRSDFCIWSMPKQKYKVTTLEQKLLYSFCTTVTIACPCQVYITVFDFWLYGWKEAKLSWHFSYYTHYYTVLWGQWSPGLRKNAKNTTLLNI